VLRVLIAFMLALFLTYVMASALATQVILGELRGMGMSVTLADHFRATFHDLRGLLTSYLPLLAIALTIGLAVAGALGRRLPRWRSFLYPFASAAAVLAIHLCLELLLGINGIAAVREWHGMALQAFAGWMGGYFFVIFLGLARR
jgi:hypothetical protein